MVYEHDKVIHLDDNTFDELTSLLVGDSGHDFRNKDRIAPSVGKLRGGSGMEGGYIFDPDNVLLPYSATYGSTADIISRILPSIPQQTKTLREKIDDNVYLLLQFYVDIGVSETHLKPLINILNLMNFIHHVGSNLKIENFENIHMVLVASLVAAIAINKDNIAEEDEEETKLEADVQAEAAAEAEAAKMEQGTPPRARRPREPAKTGYTPHSKRSLFAPSPDPFAPEEGPFAPSSDPFAVEEGGGPAGGAGSDDEGEGEMETDEFSGKWELIKANVKKIVLLNEGVVDLHGVANEGLNISRGEGMAAPLPPPKGYFTEEEEASDVDQGTDMRRTVSIGDIIVPMTPLERFRHTAEKVILGNRQDQQIFADELKTNLDIVGDIFEDLSNTLELFEDERLTDFTDKPITEFYLDEREYVLDKQLQDFEEMITSQEMTERMLDFEEELEEEVKQKTSSQKSVGPREESEDTILQEILDTKEKSETYDKKRWDTIRNYVANRRYKYELMLNEITDKTLGPEKISKLYYVFHIPIVLRKLLRKAKKLVKEKEEQQQQEQSQKQIEIANKILEEAEDVIDYVVETTRRPRRRAAEKSRQASASQLQAEETVDNIEKTLPLLEDDEYGWEVLLDNFKELINIEDQELYSAIMKTDRFDEVPVSEVLGSEIPATYNLFKMGVDDISNLGIGTDINKLILELCKTKRNKLKAKLREADWDKWIEKNFPLFKARFQEVKISIGDFKKVNQFLLHFQEQYFNTLLPNPNPSDIFGKISDIFKSPSVAAQRIDELVNVRIQEWATAQYLFPEPPAQLSPGEPIIIDSKKGSTNNQDKLESIRFLVDGNIHSTNNQSILSESNRTSGKYRRADGAPIILGQYTKIISANVVAHPSLASRIDPMPLINKMSEVTGTENGRNVDLKYVVRSNNGRSITTEIILNDGDKVNINFTVNPGEGEIPLVINASDLDFEKSSPLSVTAVMKRLLDSEALSTRIKSIDHLKLYDSDGNLNGDLFNECLKHLPLKAVGDYSQELYALFPNSLGHPGVFFSNDRFSNARNIILKLKGKLIEGGQSIPLSDLGGGSALLSYSRPNFIYFMVLMNPVATTADQGGGMKKKRSYKKKRSKKKKRSYKKKRSKKKRSNRKKKSSKRRKNTRKKRKKSKRKL